MNIKTNRFSFANNFAEGMKVESFAFGHQARARMNIAVGDCSKILKIEPFSHSNSIPCGIPVDQRFVVKFITLSQVISIKESACPVDKNLTSEIEHDFISTAFFMRRDEDDQAERDIIIPSLAPEAIKHSVNVLSVHMAMFRGLKTAHESELSSHSSPTITVVTADMDDFANLKKAFREAGYSQTSRPAVSALADMFNAHRVRTPKGPIVSTRETVGRERLRLGRLQLARIR